MDAVATAEIGPAMTGCAGESAGERVARVAVVGGGLAGLAAAVALRQHGLEVALFEARRRLGGRAGSFCDPRFGDWIDHGQHVAMGCCTNLADFGRRTGIAGDFQTHRRLHFIGPDGRRHDFSAAGWLPAPLHLVPGLLRLRYLSLRDRLGIAAAIARLAGRAGHDPADATTIGQWLHRQGQSPQAIEQFWSAVLVSALSETVDRASLAAARKVFLDGFLTSARAYELEIPQDPLSEIYDRRVGAWLEAHGVEVHRSVRVRRIEGDGRRAGSILLADGSRRRFDFFVAAVPWRAVRGLLVDPLREAIPALSGLDCLQPAPITALHLWLDRPITGLPHAVLVGRLGQWLFNKGVRALGPNPPQTAHYYQVVISASQGLKGRKRADVLGQVRGELEAIWPAAGQARLLHWRMLTEPEAVFSIRPGIDRLRPPQPTPVPNLMLAGDWTATGWPATMEGAVRSGYLAAQAILESLGVRRPVLAPDLPRARLTRWLFPG
jgi:squalene-associated FAD-dependent desaturase